MMNYDFDVNKFLQVPVTKIQPSGLFATSIKSIIIFSVLLFLHQVLAKTGNSRRIFINTKSERILVEKKLHKDFL